MKLRSKLNGLKMSLCNNDFQKYLFKFQQIANKIDDFPEKELIYHFLDGLPDKVKYDVLAQGASTMVDTIKFAGRYSECYAKSSKTEVEVSNFIKADTGFKRTPFRNSSFQNKRFNGSNYRQNRNRYRSFSNGRYKNDLKRRRFDRSSSSQRYSQSPGRDVAKSKQTDIRRIQCYNCKKYGHMASKCRVKKINIIETDDDNVSCNSVEVLSVSTKISLLNVKGTIDGIKMKFSLDSGATGSILAAKRVYENGMKVLPSNIKIKTADGVTSAIIGTTEELCVVVCGYVTKLKFLIIEDDDHDALLGLDWFMATGAGLCPAEGTLRFPGKTVYLHENGNECEYEFTENDEWDLLTAETPDDETIPDEMDWDSENMIIKPESALDRDQMKLFRNLIDKFTDVFAQGLGDLKECNAGTHKIRVFDVPPIYVPPYRVSIKESEYIEAEIKEMLKYKIIEPSISPWSAPITLAPKKDGKKRMCVDFRKLNAVTIAEKWSIPRVQDLLDRR